MTLAGTFPQSLDIDDLNAAARIFYEASLFKSICDNVYTSTTYPQHFGEELLREGKRVTLRQIASAEEPAGKTLVNRVNDVAGGCLLRLREDRLFMSDQKRTQGRALRRSLFQGIDVAYGRIFSSSIPLRRPETIGLSMAYRVTCRCELIAIAVAWIDNDPVVGDRLIDAALEVAVADIEKTVSKERTTGCYPVAHKNS